MDARYLAGIQRDWPDLKRWLRANVQIPGDPADRAIRYFDALLTEAEDALSSKRPDGPGPGDGGGPGGPERPGRPGDDGPADGPGGDAGVRTPGSEGSGLHANPDCSTGCWVYPEPGRCG